MMRRGDRIRAIRRIADAIEALDWDWTYVDLVLRQFDFPTSDFANGSQADYVMNHIQDGADEALVELEEFVLGGPSETDSVDTADVPWEAGTLRLFISHTSGHASLAGKVRDIFRRWRIDAFVAHDTIEPTRPWQHTIEGALETCDALAAFLTDDFVASKWCDQEVGYALAKRVPIVPVKLDANPHGFIAKYQAAPVSRGTPGEVADAVFRALLRHQGTRDAMAAPVVHRYATSRSFDGARANFLLLQEVPAAAWTRDLVNVAERAATDNDQIENAVLLGSSNLPMPAATTHLLRPVKEQLGMNDPPSFNDDDIPF